MSTFDTDDIPTNPTDNLHFNRVVARAVSRRGFMKTGLGLGAVGFLGGTLAACGGDSDSSPIGGGGGAPGAGAMLGFAAVAAATGDDIIVPEGYRHQVITRWGDPLFANSPAWRGDARGDAAAQALQVGDNHDGMHFFPLAGSSEEGLLVMNHEYLNDEYFYPPEVVPGGENWTLDDVRKGQNAHGITVAHVRRGENGEWRVVIPSRYNRRLHGNSPMALTGPAAGHALLQTKADPTGTVALGTLNNCGNGFTPWGTYLTCEENFNGYFGSRTEADTRDANQRRYGINAYRSWYRWEDHDDRFDYKIEPNEANRFGWIVEIDPFDPSSTPKKRTALGRFKHENCAIAIAPDGRVVVYMGDDQANDYVYKFISDDRYEAGNAAGNRNLLENGKLYVARFMDGNTSGDMMGVGEWILLDRSTATTDGRTLGDLFADHGELLVNTRAAADAVGATPMDRPEWVTVHPATQEVYLTLTNNSGRKEGDTDDANPRANNVYGQIIRWREQGGDATAETFEWDLFVLAGNPTVHAEGLNQGSANVTPENIFNSPDGLAFDADGRLWIQTDGNFSNAGAYAGMGNNQMLVGDPTTGEIRRFLVGPSGCEVTGITWTPDQRAVFINIQHPGEYGAHPRRPEVAPQEDPLAFSRWPEASGGRPRSATVVIWKEDGGKVGA